MSTIIFQNNNFVFKIKLNYFIMIKIFFRLLNFDWSNYDFAIKNLICKNSFVERFFVFP